MVWRSANGGNDYEGMILQHRRRRRCVRCTEDAQTLFLNEAGEHTRKAPAKIWFMRIFYSWVIAIFTFTKICAYSLVRIRRRRRRCRRHRCRSHHCRIPIELFNAINQNEVSKNRWIVQLYGDVNSGHEFRLHTRSPICRSFWCVVHAMRFFPALWFKTKSAKVENRIVRLWVPVCVCIFRFFTRFSCDCYCSYGGPVGIVCVCVCAACGRVKASKSDKY